PAPHRYAARLYEAMGLIELAAESSERECACDPRDGSAWARLGSLRIRLLQPEAAKAALTRARRTPGATVDTLLDLSLANYLLGDLVASAECAQTAVKIDNDSAPAWVSLAHALDRTGAQAECIVACNRAIRLGNATEEIANLLLRKRNEEPRELPDVAVN
ncbi:MAG: hypothetical protein JHC87_09275, partial [Thermoleophilaceae bacterium]|nr:hypothetical protein [Thermoleophilaceae bacterium]